MAFQPPPQADLKNVPIALQMWYNQIRQFVSAGIGTIPWSAVSKVGANLTDIPTRNHNDLQNIQGGTALERYHLTAAQVASLGIGVTPSVLHGNDGDPGEDAFPIPGAQGPAGAPGSTGPQGIQGFGSPGVDGIDGEDIFPLVGPMGPTGQTGATGPGGSGAPGVDGTDGEEVMMFMQAQVSTVNANTSTLINSLGVVTLSGTSTTLTTLVPATARRITLLFDVASTTGTSDLLIQIGSAGGFETTGYVSESGIFTAAASSTDTVTTGYVVRSPTATNALSGEVVLELSGNTNQWISRGVFRVNTSTVGISAGSKTLAGTLDRILVTTVAGTDTFDAGTITILYENAQITGLIGPQGNIGPPGIGEEGPQGEDSWIAGPIGPRGFQGDRGPIGDTGDNGEDALMIPGNQGPQGTLGATGPMGPIGFEGEPGYFDEFVPGPQGPTGPAGAATDPVLGSYTPGSFTIPTGKYAVMSHHLILTGSQRVTLQGTATLRIT